MNPHALGVLISRLDTDGLGDGFEEDREDILAAVRHYAKRKLATPEFIPGTTPVPMSGTVSYTHLTLPTN